MSHAGSRRRGFGLLLVLVIVVLLVIAVVALQRALQSGQVRDGVRRTVVGRVAAELARAAREEARHTLQHSLADPSSEGRRALDSPLDSRPSIRLPVPQLKRIMQSDVQLIGYELVGSNVQLEVLERRPVADSPKESSDVLRLTAEVRHRTSGLSRRLVSQCAARRTLVTVPPPYDQFSLTMLDPRPLHGGAGWVRERMDAAVSSLRTQVQSDLPRMLELIRRTAASGGIDPEVVLRPLDETEIFAPPEISEDVTEPLHYLADNLVISTKAERIDDLAQLNLKSRLLRHEADIVAPARQEYLLALQALESMDRTGQGAQSLGDVVGRLAMALHRVSKANSGELELVKNYTDSVIELVDEGADWLRDNRWRLEPAEWRSRATFRFHGPGAVRRFLEFVSRYEARREGINGVVVIEDPAEVLRIARRTLQGKLVLVCAGDVEVQDVSLGNPDALLTVQCQGNLRAAGRVEAFLISQGAFLPDPGLELVGGLVLSRVEDPARLVGRLRNPHVRDQDHGRYFCGSSGDGETRAEYIHASLGPWMDWTQLQRH